jgi:hypothetical protein
MFYKSPPDPNCPPRPIELKEPSAALQRFLIPDRSKKRNLQINLTRFATAEDRTEMVTNGLTPTQNRIIESIYKKDPNNFFSEEYSILKSRGELSPLKSLRVSPIQVTRPVIKPLHICEPDLAPQYKLKKIKHLTSLFSVLVQAFIEVTPKEIGLIKLSNLELLILQNIFERKFTVRTELYNNPRFIDEMADRLPNIYNQPSRKRKEENIKFVFKWMMKKMRKKFRMEVEGPPNEFHDFYQHFFEKSSADENLPIESFYDPTNVDKGSCERPELLHKSINTDYLSQVFRCSGFREAFTATLTACDVHAEYTKRLEKKIEKLLSRWDKLLLKHSISQLESKVHDYFKTSLRCKLPWTLREANQAVHCFTKFISTLKLD